MANEYSNAGASDATRVGIAVQPRSVDAGRGASWWSEAWRLFTPAVGTWLIIVIVLFVLNIVFTFIPIVGHLAGQILFPAIVAGLMVGCREIDRGRPMTVAHLFAGFSERSGPLMMLGLIYTLFVIAIVAAVFAMLFAMFGAAVLGDLWHMQDSLSLSSALGNLMLALLVGLLVFLLLYLPLIMAIWFAPALVIFQKVDPWTAMKLSFAGCMTNMLPFLVYGIVGVVLSIAASLPMMLGWIVLVPVSLASIYTGYCDIFEDRGIAASAAPAAPSI